MRRQVLTYAALALGAAMVLIGLFSFLTPTPHPELATGGAALILATGLVGNGNGPAKRRGR